MTEKSNADVTEIAQNIRFDATFLPIVATSFTIFLILYKFINPYISNIVFRGYGSLSEGQKIDWSTR